MPQLTHSDVRRILEVLDHASQFDVLEVRVGDFLLQARKKGAPALSVPVAASIHAPVAVAEKTERTAPQDRDDVPAGMVAVRAPMVGTFYRRSKPEAPAFVEAGACVAPGDTLGLLEAMKLFSAVTAPVAGIVQRIVAADGDVVQRGDVLLFIAPEKAE